MPLIQVRDVPEHIYRQLSEEAKREHRSLAQQVIMILARGIQVETDPKSRRRRILQDVRKAGGPTGSLTDAAKLIREDRNR